MEKFFNLFERILNEEKEVTYSYGCVMLSLDVDEKWWNTILDTIDKDDVYNGSKTDKDKYGLEKEPHITILYGIHSDEVEDDKVKEIAEKIKNPDIDLNKLSIFENPKYDVLKFEISNKELTRMNKLFKKLPFTSDFPDYKAHATIGYLKPGTGKKYIGNLDNSESRTVTGKDIAYSKPNNEYINYDI